MIAGEYLEPEQSDAINIIRWISRQRWCNGSVGMRGASWGAFSALHAAGAAPEELKAIVSLCGSENGRVAHLLAHRSFCFPYSSR